MSILKADFSIIIVNYNVRILIQKCLTSIFESLKDSNLKFEVIVIDNCSADGSNEMIKNEFKNVILIENKVNVGFPAANNQGFNICQGSFVFMLNPDTEIIDDAIEKLFHFISKHKEYALIAPKLLNTNRTHQYSVWRFPTLYYVFAELFHLNFLIKRKNYIDKDFNQLFIADSFSGAALFFNRSLLDEIGLLNESLFWIEDIDYCFRINAAGLKMAYYPEAQIIHHIGQSAKKNYNISISNQIYNKIKFFNTHHSHLKTNVVKLLSFFGVLFKIVSFLILSPFKEVYRLKLKAYIYTLSRVFNPPQGIQ